VEGSARLHRSPHKGFSVEFKSTASSARDEIRHLDWRIFGKTDRSISASTRRRRTSAPRCCSSGGRMNYGIPGPLKLVYAQRLAACSRTSCSASRQRRPRHVRHESPPYIPPGRRRATSRSLNELEATNSGGEPSWPTSSRPGHADRWGMVIILSDCSAKS